MKSLISISLLMALSTSAFAQQAGQAATGSDYTADEFHLTLKPGKIQTRNKLLSLQVSGYENSDSQNIGSVKLGFGKKLVPGTADRDGYYGNWQNTDSYGDDTEGTHPGPTLVFDMNLDGRIDYNKDTGRIVRAEAKGPEITLLGRQFLTYDVDGKGGDKPYRTTEYRFLNFGTSGKVDRRNKVMAYGGEFSAFKGSVHGAGLIDGKLPVEVCFSAKAASVVVGDTETQGKNSWLDIHPLIANFCAGIGAGPLGMIRDEAQFDFGVNLHGAKYVEVTNTIGLERRIGPVRVGAGYTYEYTHSDNGQDEGYVSGSEHKHMITTKLAY